VQQAHKNIELKKDPTKVKYYDRFVFYRFFSFYCNIIRINKCEKI